MITRSALFFACSIFFPLAGHAIDLPPSLLFHEGSPNAVSLIREGAKIDINLGADRGKGIGEVVMLTHARREVTELALPEGSRPSTIMAPSASREFLEDTANFWEQWWTKRFDYYEQQVTRRPLRDVVIDRYLADGETFTWRDLEIRHLATPGYTRDGGTYLVNVDGVKIAFTGELVREGGRVADLYSFQEAIPEAKVGGYHGYLGRLPAWLASLEKLAAEKPDLIVPWRGAIITDPARDLAAAAEKARAIYRNYLETNALHWYFGEERMSTCAALVLGPDHGVRGMPFAEHVDLPAWCQHIGTTKLLVSSSGRGFLLDVGGPSALKSLEAFRAEGLVKEIDGIFATHVHNDHTGAVGEAARRYGCPVYATPEVAPILTRPGDWFLPGISPNRVDAVTTRQDGDSMKWEEFTFTFRSFPGQMLNHGALFVEKAGETPVFFIGDSFSPSGIDDYCLMNRNLLREDSGYRKCFDIVAALPPGTWLVNQHIPHRFRFNAAETEFLLSRYRQRIELIGGFVAGGEVDNAVDEQWAWIRPYGIEAKRGETVTLTLRISNHATKAETFMATWHPPFGGESSTASSSVAARGEGEWRLSLAIPDDARPGVHVVTADVARGDLLRPHWAEALVKVVD